MTRTRPNLFRDLLLATSALVASSALALSVAHADGDVSGGKVVVGKAVITTSGGLTTIEQASKKALINWNSFSIPSGSTVNFEQPGSKSITVNRVTGSDPSNIFGNLLANGRIWLINSNGILFGHGSQINVGSLIATTSDISDSDFKNGHYKFAASKNPNASVVNQGTIHAADHGSVVLSAPHVSNDGVIQANLGTVVLGGANAFSVDLTGDNLIRYQVTQPVSQTQKNADGTAAALVSNSGTIIANGGKVLMTARAAQQVEDNVINNTGMVQATSVSSHNGEIVLDAGDGGTVNAGGTLDASGKAAGQTGGSVTITGSTVNVADGAKLDASGDLGGGTVLIGGGVRGEGSLQHATTTNIGNATITADAITKGNGGTVAVWSDGNTKFAGHVSARGGAQGGNGGFVETSGRNLSVDPSATVNTMAAAGKTGLWLLDPQNIDIIDGGGDGLNGSNIDPQTIINALGTTDVELEATNDITIDSDVIYNSGNAFTMLAGSNIVANASVQNSGAGDINLIAGWDGTTTDLGSLLNPGVFGNNNGSVLIGTDSGQGTVAIGSKGGTTNVAGANVLVETGDGLSQIGYNGAGDGDINVLAAQTIDVLSDGFGTAQIGNGGLNVTGNIGGDISVKLTGPDGQIFLAYGGAQPGEAPGAAIIGNTGSGNSSESGDILVDADGGAVTLGSVGVFGVAQIGNRNWGTSTGTASGDITVNAGVLSMVAGAGTEFDQSDNRAQIGNGAKAFGTSLGGVSGDIDVNAGSLLMESIGDDVGNNYAEVRIGNLAAAPVSGDLTINTTGDVDILSEGFSLANIGNLSDPVDVNGNPVQSSNTGDLTVNSGGAISITALDGGEARIESGGLTSGSVSVTADGDILLSATGTSTVSPTTAEIGSLSAGDVNGSITVTSTHGNIELDAGDTDTAQIGVLNGTPDTNIDADITVSAGGDLSLTSSGSGSAIIGNGNAFGQNNTAGDIAINVAGLTTVTNDGGTAWIGNLAGDGFTETGNLTLISGALSIDNAGEMFGADLGTSAETGGDVTIGVTGTDPLGIGGDVEYSSPHTLSILAAGDIDLVSAIENDGSGNINVVAGWDGQTLDSSQFTNSGVFGNNGGSLNVGGGDGSDSSLGQGSGNAGIGTAGGTLTVAADNVTLDAANGFAQLGYAGAGSGDITVTTAGDIALTGGASDGEYAQIGNGANGGGGDVSGNITVTAGGDVTLQGGGQPFGTYAQIGNGGDDTDGNVTGNISVTDASLTLTADEGRAQVGNGGAASDGDFTGDITVNSNGDVSITGGGVETWGFAMIGNGGDSTFGNDSGNISVTAGGNLSLIGGGDFVQIGNGGWGSEGTHQGDITVNAADVSVGGGEVNEFSYAQIGNGGEDSEGDNSGDIAISASGDVTLTGTGRYAQIGHGGGFSIGNNSGDITIAAAGNVSLTGGDAQEAYAQIGHGGAESNEDSEAYSNTGLITVSGESVSLQGGTGEEAYSQIGQGGFLSGDGLQGKGVNSGDITVNSQTIVSLLGGADDAYAQIGNGGDQVNAEAGAEATADFEGNIMVTALTTNGISATGGTGNNAYAQIGNGGLGIQVQTTAPSSNFTVGGNIMVSGLTLTGGNTGTNAYAQLGNGDAALNSVADITGDITIIGGTTTTNGIPTGSVALIGNATGTGTVSGSINGGGGQDQTGDQQGTIASLIQTINTVNFDNITPPSTFPVADEFMTQGAEIGSEPAGPLQQMANSDESGEGKEQSDAVANSVGKSLSGKGHKQARVAQVIIPGVLKQIVLVNAVQPKGVPPADEDYSSWGNEAFWQW